MIRFICDRNELHTIDEYDSVVHLVTSKFASYTYIVF